MADTDRELLENAAKAASFGYGEWTKHGIVFAARDAVWNPLHDDGDALRLAAKLGISVSFSHSTGLDVAYPAIVEVGAFAGWCPTYTEVNHEDWLAATRRAIVRAAAAMADSNVRDPSKGGA